LQDWMLRDISIKSHTTLINMATIQVQPNQKLTDVFGETITIINIKEPFIDDKDKEKDEKGNYPKKHNVIDATFVKVVVFSLVDTVRKATESGEIKTNVKTLEKSIAYGKLAQKIVTASAVEDGFVDIIAGGKDDEIKTIEEAVHEYYENVEIDLAINKILNPEKE
jgi:hypothetical protein